MEHKDILSFNNGLHHMSTVANRAADILVKMFKLAQGWNMVPAGRNPCRLMRRYREESRERFLSPDEWRRLGRALREAEADGSVWPQAIAALRLLLLTGYRRQEIVTLRWDDVDRTARELRLRHTKTGPRMVPLTTWVERVLDGIPRVEGSPWVIPGRKPGRHLADLHDNWERIRDRAGLENMRIHDIRHSYSSRALGVGESLTMIGRLFGHSKVTATARYARLARDSEKEAAARVVRRMPPARCARRIEERGRWRCRGSWQAPNGDRRDRVARRRRSSRRLSPKRLVSPDPRRAPLLAATNRPVQTTSKSSRTNVTPRDCHSCTARASARITPRHTLHPASAPHLRTGPADRGDECAPHHPFVHETRIAGPDRRGLERLCRYVARPALAGGRLRVLDADPLSFALKTPWSDGTRHLLLSPMELLEKLTALVPPPRLHLLRYHGVLAPRARARDRIVPAQPGAEPAAADASTSAAACGHRLRWATLLARVFSSDLSRCSSSPPDLPSRPLAGRTGWVCPQRSLRPPIDPDTGGQATKLYCEFGRRIGKRSSQGAS